MGDIEAVLSHAKKNKLRILRGSDPKLIVKRIPFDIPQLDTVLGGGLPLGRMTLVVGNFGAGKTFFAQMAMKLFQQHNLLAAYVDTERRFDRDWWIKSGVNVDNLLVGLPHSGENAIDMCTDLIKDRVGLVVLDSIAALVPMAELEGSAEDSTIASQARLLNKGLRKITDLNIAGEEASDKYEGSAFLALNQMRSGMGPYSTYALPGGKGQQYFSSILLRVQKGPWILEGKDKVGFDMKFTTDKNNLTEWPLECALPFKFTGVIDTVGGLLELAIDVGVILQKGAYYYLPEGLGTGKGFQGKQALIELLKTDGDLFEKIKAAVYASNNPADRVSLGTTPNIGEPPVPF